MKDKNPAMKELTQRVDDLNENNTEFQKKLFEETEKHDNLLDELTNRKESYRLALAKNDETEEILKVQQDELDARKVENETKENDRKEQLKKVEQMRKDNIFEDEKHRQFQKLNAALKAKLEFIEEKYDYTSAVKNLSITDFVDLINAHNTVNNTMGGFKDKLADVQQQIQQIEAEKNMMNSK